MIINGGTRKKEFIEALDNKTFGKLSYNLKAFVKTIFPKIRNKDILLCKKYNGMNANLILKVNDCVKYIALKSGNTSVVFKDYIYNFMTKMSLLEVSNKTVISIYKYHTGYVKNSDISSFGSLLKEDFKEEIEIVKTEFEKPILLSKLIDFVLINEKNGICIDYFYYGNVDIGFTISAQELKEKIINEKNNYPHDFMRLGPFNFLPVDRKIKASNNTLCQLRINNFYKYFK